MIDWAHAGPTVVAAFLASLVEFVEALTIVLAVGTTRGWRTAMLGTAAGTIVLVVLVLLLGPALQVIPLTVLQLVVGVLLLLFGMRWLRKAILRAGGLIALHDEVQVFADETRQLSGAGRALVAGVDAVGFVTTFKAVILEGLEVVFIVVAIGAVGGMLIPASLGAAAALVIVVLLGLVLHRPLARVPENGLKFAVGILIAAFGVFWVGEGLGLEWPGEEWALFGLALGLLCAAALAVRLVRRGVTAAPQPTTGTGT